MMSGEGGMVTTNDDAIAERARMIRNHGMSKQYLHEIVGFNFRMTNLAAAIGVEQIKRLPAWTAQRQANAGYYSENLEGVNVTTVRDGYTHVYHQYTIILPDNIDRDAVMKQLNDAGVGARVYYPLPIHCQPVMRDGWAACDTPCAHGYMRECPELPTTIDLTNRVISLPVHPMLTQEEREYVVNTVNAIVAG